MSVAPAPAPPVPAPLFVPTGPPPVQYDENGEPIKRKRGRPKKEEYFLKQNVQVEDVYTPPLDQTPRTPPPPLVGPNGEIIKRGRGRPRKYPRPDEA